MKTYFIKDAHGPHYEWLMEKTKNLVEYAKREDYKKVAAFCENILEGLRNNKLVDSKTKDSSINPDTTYKLEYNYYNADVYDNDNINKEKIEFQKELRKYNLKIISLKRINGYDGNVSAIIEGKGRDIKKFMRHAGEPDEEVISEMIIS